MTERLISIIKLALGIIILPLVIATTAAFFVSVNSLPRDFGDYFFWGIIVYLILHLFMFEPTGVYEKGQAIVGAIFKFFAPLGNVLSIYLPIYAVITLLLYFLIALFTDVSAYAWVFLVLVGFALALHIINSVKPLRARGEDFLKGHYFLSIEFVYIIGIFITAGILHCLILGFEFLEFVDIFTKFTKYIYSAAFRQLFL